MNRRNVRRLGVVALLLTVLILATAAPAMPAEPEAANLGLSVPVSWAGHPQCKANVVVSLSGDSVDVGGYETQVNFDGARYGYTAGNISLTNFLSDGGTRSTSGADGTPFLEAVGANKVKFGDYSWGTSAGADAPGTLATVGLNVVACGTGTVSLSASQVVDYQGTPFGLGTQASVQGTVAGLYDINNSGGNITGADVTAVLNGVGTSSACNANYHLDVNNTGGNITGADVTLVLNNVGSPSCP